MNRTGRPRKAAFCAKIADGRRCLYQTPVL